MTSKDRPRQRMSNRGTTRRQRLIHDVLHVYDCLSKGTSEDKVRPTARHLWKLAHGDRAEKNEFNRMLRDAMNSPDPIRDKKTDMASGVGAEVPLKVIEDLIEGMKRAAAKGEQ